MLERQPSHALFEVVATVQDNLICGVATPEEVDAYAWAQLELARRTRLELLLDPRD